MEGVRGSRGEEEEEGGDVGGGHGKMEHCQPSIFSVRGTRKRKGEKGEAVVLDMDLPFREEGRGKKRRSEGLNLIRLK